MKKRTLLLGLLWASTAAIAAGSFAANAAGWGEAIEVPRTAMLNSGGSAEVNSVSCAAAGACVAGGDYRDGSGHVQAFVVSERYSRWGHAISVPGAATLNRGGNAGVSSVSCAAAGECLAGGYYQPTFGQQAFVVSERHGRWGHAMKVPGTGTLNRGALAAVVSVSCAAVGECVAGGSYEDAANRVEAFVASETHGRWGHAMEVPGTAALNRGGEAHVESVSCAGVSACVAGGDYLDGSGNRQAFVVTERHGRWARAIEVPGTAALNSGKDAYLISISCAAVGECVAGGFYADGSHAHQAFVVRKRRGHWGHAVEVPGTAALNFGGYAGVNSVSCAAVDECAAGGFYADAQGAVQAFAVNETSGRWRKAIEVPGTAPLNTGGSAEVFTVSCAKAGACVAGGYYRDGSTRWQAFVVSEINGRWDHAIEIPGTDTLNSGGNAHGNSASCAPGGACVVGGSYTDGSGARQSFVAKGRVAAKAPMR